MPRSTRRSSRAATAWSRRPAWCCPAAARRAGARPRSRRRACSAKSAEAPEAGVSAFRTRRILLVPALATWSRLETLIDEGDSQLASTQVRLTIEATNVNGRDTMGRLLRQVRLAQLALTQVGLPTEATRVNEADLSR